MHKILVLRGGALGDFLVTLPALGLLRRRWPGAEIVLAGNATAAALAQARGLVTTVHSQHERRWATLYGAPPLPADFASWLATFDLVLNYWPDPDGELRRRFPLRPGQTFLEAPATPQCAPAAAHYCQPLAALGLTTRELVYPLAAHVAAPLPATSPIAVHPGSGSPRKNWPRAHWLALLRALPAPATLILGEAEAAHWPADLLPALPRLVQAPLEHLVDLLVRCRCFLGHDSGVSHLAAACGAPSLLLFGPTEPAIWAPPAPFVRVLRRRPDLAHLSVDEVRAVLQDLLRDTAEHFAGV